MRELKPPLSLRDVEELEAGEVVELTGRMIVARDRAHLRLLELSRRNEPPPVELRGAVVFHGGPIASRGEGGWRVASMGPTTSARFEELAVEVCRRLGVRALVGKGGLSPSCSKALREAGAVYLAYPGGAGVLAARSVVRVEEVHWLDLGIPEALWVLEVRKLAPLLVAIDLKGGDLYEEAAARAQRILRELKAERRPLKP